MIEVSKKILKKIYSIKKEFISSIIRNSYLKIKLEHLLFIIFDEYDKMNLNKRRIDYKVSELHLSLKR